MCGVIWIHYGEQMERVPLDRSLSAVLPGHGLLTLNPSHFLRVNGGKAIYFGTRLQK
jgi:hypothetical protein